MSFDWFKGRYVIVAIAAFAGFYLFRLGTSSDLSAGPQFLALAAGFVLFVVATVVLFRDYRSRPLEAAEVSEPEPGIAHFLFHSARSAPLWLGARVYLGYEWFQAGREKLGEDAWMDGGAALRGYWEHAVAVPEGAGRRSPTAGIGSISSTCSITSGTHGSRR